MSFTSLKLEETSEYHCEQDKYENRLARRRHWMLVAVKIISIPVVVACLLYIGDSLEPDSVLSKALASGLAAGFLAVIIYGFRWLGAKFKDFWRW